MNKYNLDKLIKVKVNEISESSWYEYKKEIKILGITFQKEGVYDIIWKTYEGKEAPKNHIIRNNAVYEMANVVLYYENDFSRMYVFNSFTEAKEFSEEITSVGRWIS